MGIVEQMKELNEPIAQLTAKYRSTIFYLNGTELVRSKEYLEVGAKVTAYSTYDGLADIGAGRFIKEVDTKHFDISFGKLHVHEEGVYACSRNGMKLRKLSKGCEYNVVAINRVANAITIYQINELEYLSSDDAIEFVTECVSPSQGATIRVK